MARNLSLFFRPRVAPPFNHTQAAGLPTPQPARTTAQQLTPKSKRAPPTSHDYLVFHPRLAADGLQEADAAAGRRGRGQRERGSPPLSDHEERWVLCLKFFVGVDCRTRE